MSETNVSRELREAGRQAREAARWAEVLTPDERAELSRRLGDAIGWLSGVRADDGLFSPPHISTRRDLADLRMDLAGRDGVHS